MKEFTYSLLLFLPAGLFFLPVYFRRGEKFAKKLFNQGKIKSMDDWTKAFEKQILNPVSLIVSAILIIISALIFGAPAAMAMIVYLAMARVVLAIGGAKWVRKTLSIKPQSS